MIGRGSRRFARSWSIPLALGFALASCDATRAEPAPLPEPSEELQSIATAEDPFDPIPSEVHADLRKVALGRRLFAERRLSGDASVACKDCHLPEKGGGDGLPTAHHPARDAHAYNTPSIYNLAFDSVYNWNGKVEDLARQVGGPLTLAPAMRATWKGVIAALRGSGEYGSDFAAIYPAGITAESISDAIATYERSLVTPGAPFDRYLVLKDLQRRGVAGPDPASALTPDALAGYALFKSYGCVSCHQGRNLGGNLFQKFGVIGDYFGDRGHVEEADLGRFNVPRDEKDRFVFRVPSLRNVAKTAPYFHDGAAATLEDAVRTMARVQLGRSLDDGQVRQVVAFLKSLTGDPAGFKL